MMTDMTRREFLGKASAAGAMAAFGGCAGVGETRGARWYRGMLHMHTLWSDGRALPEQAVAAYKDAGYDFISISDHNRFGVDPDRWMDVEDWTGKKWPPKTVHPAVAAAYRKRFPDARVRTKDGKEQIRLMPYDELKRKFEERGKFLLLPGVELTCDMSTGKSDIRNIHMNVIGLGDIIERAKKAPLVERLPNQTIASAIRESRELCDELARKRGERYLFMVDHPSWLYMDVTAEDIIANPEVRFFEVRNNGAEWPLPDGVGLDRERDGWYEDVLWDVVLAHRAAKGGQLLYGFGSDDAHFYPGDGNPDCSGWGNAYIMVRAKELTPEALMDAIFRNDFYASCGVDLEDVAFDRSRGELSVAVPAKPGVSYKIRFIVTKRGTPVEPVKYVEIPPTPAHFNRGWTVPTYDKRVGETAKLVEGRPGEAVRASYRLGKDDLYVRARVESDEAPVYKKKFQGHPHVKVAWTQPFAGVEEMT